METYSLLGTSYVAEDQLNASLFRLLEDSVGCLGN